MLPKIPFPQGDGIDGTLQRIALSAINGAACELGTGREELILSLERRSGFGPEVTWTEDTLEEALRAGLIRAIDDADERDTLPGLAARGSRSSPIMRRSTGSWAASTFRSSRTEANRPVGRRGRFAGRRPRREPVGVVGCAPMSARSVSARPFVWFVHVALPLLGLWLLVEEPQVDHDLMWQHQPSHFWLVLITAVISCALAIKAALEARRHDDARLFLVAMSFLIAAGFLGLHALGTPTVLIEVSNTGFVLATPVGLTLAVIPAVASAFIPARLRPVVVRNAPWLLGGVLALFVVWAVWSLARWAPLDGQPTVEQHRSDFAVIVVPAAMLFCAAALIYFLQYLKRPSMVLLSVLTAFVLLAEAAVATLVGRSWEASWWTWHILMTIAFAPRRVRRARRVLP